MQLAFSSMETIKTMAESGNPNSVSDAGVGALCARAAVEGAFLNVKINTTGFSDKVFSIRKLEHAEKILKSAKEYEKLILEMVHKKIEL